MTTLVSSTTVEDAAVLTIPLNQLKTSPKNARKTPHEPADIEALAASIAEKGVLQPLVVEPETDGEGAATGYFLVTIGEGRRKALMLLASHKRLKTTHPVRCVVDLRNDAHEISLDENVTRFTMHPADEFEAFQRLAVERGYGPEEIGARFGKSAHVVRQRLKLAAVSPALMQGYRDGLLTLEQLMAFTLTGDHARQDAVHQRLGQDATPSMIRRLLTEGKVHASDRRAMFVGAEAYEAAGGVIERDLFTEDGGGYFTDPSLLDRLTWEELEKVADVQRGESWGWAEAALDYPVSHGFKRLYPRVQALSEAQQRQLDALNEAAEALEAEFGSEEDVPDDVIEKYEALRGEIGQLEALKYAYDPADKARSGVFVLLGRDGQPQLERGFVRPEAEGIEGDSPSGDVPERIEVEDGATEAKPSKSRPTLSDRLVAELSAQRTAALQNALAQRPETALLVLLHTLVSKVFEIGSKDGDRLLRVRADMVDLSSEVPHLWESRAGGEIAGRQADWAARFPETSETLWAVLETFDLQDRLALLAHCLSLTLDTRELGGARPDVDAAAKDLSNKVGLRIGDYWSVTADNYLGHVTKATILDAVTEAVSARAASKIDHLKKPEMAKAAEQLLSGTGWLPPILRATSYEPQTDSDKLPQIAAE